MFTYGWAPALCAYSMPFAFIILAFIFTLGNSKINHLRSQVTRVVVVLRLSQHYVVRLYVRIFFSLQSVCALGLGRS